MVPHFGHTVAGAVIAVRADFVRAELVCLAVVETVVVTATGGVVPVGGEIHAVIGQQSTHIE